MKLCMPIESNEGLKSKLCDHFGSAPSFLILNTEDNSFQVSTNVNQHHDHGMCHPLQSLLGQTFDCIVVRGIGAGAIGKLKAANIKVYRSAGATVEAVVTSWKEGKLKELRPESACTGHHH